MTALNMENSSVSPILVSWRTFLEWTVLKNVSSIARYTYVQFLPRIVVNYKHLKKLKLHHVIPYVEFSLNTGRSRMWILFFKIGHPILSPLHHWCRDNWSKKRSKSHTWAKNLSNRFQSCAIVFGFAISYSFCRLCWVSDGNWRRYRNSKRWFRLDTGYLHGKIRKEQGGASCRFLRFFQRNCWKSYTKYCTVAAATSSKCDIPSGYIVCKKIKNPCSPRLSVCESLTSPAPPLTYQDWESFSWNFPHMKSHFILPAGATCIKNTSRGTQFLSLIHQLHPM